MHNNRVGNVGDINVKVGKEEGYYVGSASNMGRLLIFISILFMSVLCGICYMFGKADGEILNELNNKEVRIKTLESKVMALEVAVWRTKRD